jgi:hypothetical protein
MRGNSRLSPARNSPSRRRSTRLGSGNNPSPLEYPKKPQEEPPSAASLFPEPAPALNRSGSKEAETGR